MKNIRFFLFENFQFLHVKFSMYLNRLVFIMIFHISAQNIACGYIDLSMQFKWVHTIYSFIKKIRKEIHKNISIIR